MAVDVNWGAVLDAAISGVFTRKLPVDQSMQDWNNAVLAATGDCHYLQTAQWAVIKSKTAWRARQLELDLGSRVVPVVLYSRTVHGLGRIHYVPKLAKLEPTEIAAFTLKLQRTLRSGVAIRLELDQEFSPDLAKSLHAADWLSSPAIQYDHTVVIDINKPPDELLKSFKKRARWEISAAGRRGVTVEKVACTPEKMKLFLNLLRITSKRANFLTRNATFSKRYWKLFEHSGAGQLYIARQEQDILSAAYVIRVGNKAYYKDGASVRHKSNLFASRYMHWFIMQDLQKAGCQSYDMCGVIPPDTSDSKNQGLYLFKTGFADSVQLQGGYILPLGVKRYNTWKKIEPTFVKSYLTLYRDLWY